MVDIFVFCTDVEVVFSGLINKYKEAIQDMVRILGDKLHDDLIPRLMRVEFKFMPKWLHRRFRTIVMEVWREKHRSRIAMKGGA